MKSYLQRLWNRSTSNNAFQSSIIKSRQLRLESLEDREMLTVTSGEFISVKTAYPDLKLSANMADYNIIEITAADLSAAILNSAIANAKETPKTDLIFIRTATQRNQISLGGTELAIGDVDVTTKGGIIIVGYGTTPLTIDGGGKSRLFNIGKSTVGMANVILKNGDASGGEGGAIAANKSTLTLTHTTLAENTATGNLWWLSGGGVKIWDGNLTITNSTISKNKTLFGGGGVSASNTSVTFQHVTFSENEAGSYGGGFYSNAGIISITDTTFVKNKSGEHGGGAWFESGTSTLNGVTFDSNTAKWGGGLRTYKETVVASNVIVKSNTVANDGAGIDFTDSAITLSNAAFWNNEAGLYGGGLFFSNSTGTVTNVSVGENTSKTDGGGVYLRTGSNVTLVNVTIARNTAKWGGGLYLTGDTTKATLYNSIVAQNEQWVNNRDIFMAEKTVLSGSHNIVGDGTGITGIEHQKNGNLVGTAHTRIDAMVGPMLDISGTVPVMPLLSNSPAIDAGIMRSGVSTTDAVGKSRYDAASVANTGSGTPNYVDIGVFEYQGVAVTGTRVSQSGTLSSPMGMIVDSSNRLIVANATQDTVDIYSSVGAKLFSIGTWGEGNGQLHSPCDVAVDNKDNIYVVSSNNTVQVFDSTGKYLQSFGGTGTTVGKLKGPQGITYDAASNRIFIADTENQRVQCFYTDGRIDSVFGTGGIIGTTGTLQRDHNGFDQPTDVAVHPLTGNIHVADKINSRIEVYSNKGRYLRTYHAVYQPEGLAFAANGDLFIVGDDSMKDGGYGNGNYIGRLRVLRNGSELTSSTMFFGGIDDLGQRTTGVAVRADGTIYISDLYNGRIAVTQMVDTKKPFPDDIAFVETISGIEIDTYGDKVIVRWKTASPSASYLHWGNGSDNLTNTVSDATLKTNHELVITGVTPQTIIYYHIGFADSFNKNTVRWTTPDRINTGVPNGEKLVLRLKAIGLIFTDKNGGPGITQATEADIKQMEQLYRDTAIFIWQNTGFNVWIDFVAFPRYTGDYGNNTPSVEQILTGMGYGANDQFDIVLDMSNCGNGSGGGVGGSGSMFGHGVGWSHQEWDDGRTITHEVNHIFDFAIYGWNDLGKYEAIHPIWSISNAVGGERACNAAAYANYTATSAFNKWIVVPDADHDGLPDDSPTNQGLVNPLPITEKTLGSSPTKKDTDDDGISDYDEARYLIWKGSDPTKKDSDTDGILDKDDLNPVYPIEDHIAAGTPTLDGVINKNENWTVITDHWGYQNTFGTWDNNEHAADTVTTMSWDDNYLYLGIEYKGWGWVTIGIDGGYDNWHWGSCTYEVGLHPWLDSPEISNLVTVQDMQMMIAAEYGDFFKDNDPRFTKPYQGRPIDGNDGDGLGFEKRLIDPETIRYVKKYNQNTDTYTWEVAIPWSPNVTELVGYNKKVLGITVDVLGDKLFNTDTYAKIQLYDETAQELALTANKTSLNEGINDGVAFTVTRTGDISKDLIVYITSSDTTELTVPESILIPAGKSSVMFYGSSVQDDVRDENQSVTVKVTGSKASPASVNLTIVDVPPVMLNISEITVPLSASIGTKIDVRWKLTNNGFKDTGSPLTTKIYISKDNLVGDDTLLSTSVSESRVKAAETVVGTETVSISDNLAPGTYWFVISVEGEDSTVAVSTTSITISYPPLALTANKAALYEGDSSGVIFTVERTGDNIDMELVVNIQSNDQSELIVPAQVVIPAGVKTATFKGEAIQDHLADGDQWVMVTVSALKYENASFKVLVVDAKPAEISVGKVIVPPIVNHNTTIDVYWTLWNLGQNDTLQKRTEYIYISSDRSPGNDVLLATFESTDTIPAEKMLEQTRQVTLPAGISGYYFVIVKVEGENETYGISTSPMEIIRPKLALSSNVNRIDEGDTNGVTFYVTRSNGDNTHDLTLEIMTSNAEKLQVPSMVTIPAGRNSVSFVGSVPRDNQVTGNSTVRVTVSAVGYTSVYSNIVVNNVDILSPEEIVETLNMSHASMDNHWVVRKNGDHLVVLDDQQVTLFDKPLASFGKLLINATTGINATNDTLEIDFLTGGAFQLAQGIEFVGGYYADNAIKLTGSEQDEILQSTDTGYQFNDLNLKLMNVESLSFDGNDGNDVLALEGHSANDQFQFHHEKATYQTAAMAYSAVHVEKITVDAKTFGGVADVWGSSGRDIFSMYDRVAMLSTEQYQVTLLNFKTIEADLLQGNDTTYVYGEYNSLIAINEDCVERIANNQYYRVWGSDRSIAINHGGAENSLVLVRNQLYDEYDETQEYAILTNAVMAYQHEISGFGENLINIPELVPPVISPTTLLDPIMVQDIGVDMKLAMLENTLSRPTDAFDMIDLLVQQKSMLFQEIPSRTNRITCHLFDDDTIYGQWLAFLADEQVRLHQKQLKENPKSATTDLRDDFSKLALLEMRKN